MQVGIGCAVLLLGCCLAWPWAVWGEAEKAEPMLLEDVVVTATKTEKKAAETPDSVSVVTQEGMQRRNLTTVDAV